MVMDSSKEQRKICKICQSSYSFIYPIADNLRMDSNGNFIPYSSSYMISFNNEICEEMFNNCLADVPQNFKKTYEFNHFEEFGDGDYYRKNYITTYKDCYICEDEGNQVYSVLLSSLEPVYAKLIYGKSEHQKETIDELRSYDENIVGDITQFSGFFNDTLVSENVY
jgi:hypothetical protein